MQQGLINRKVQASVSRNNNSKPNAKIDKGVLQLLHELFREPEGHTPAVEFERTHLHDPLTDTWVDADVYTVVPGTMYARVGFTPNMRDMFAPQEYIFSEVTMGAREFVNYLRRYADVIEERLPSATPPNHPSHLAP